MQKKKPEKNYLIKHGELQVETTPQSPDGVGRSTPKRHRQSVFHQRNVSKLLNAQEKLSRFKSNVQTPGISSRIRSPPELHP